MICLDQFDQSMSSHRRIANLESAIHLIRGQRVMLDVGSGDDLWGHDETAQ